MRIVEDAYHGLNSLQIWYPDDSASVIEHLQRVPLVTVMQCSPSVADQLAPYAFRRRDFHTILIDLDRSEDDLWNNLEKRTCRYQLNRAKKMDKEIVVNDGHDEALALFNDFFRRHRFRAPLSRDEWQRLCTHCDLFLARHGGRAISAHIVLADGPMRARALMSATADRNDSGDRNAASALNRLLHWHEFNHYRERGFHWYDFGGIVIAETAPEFSITQFKRSFNGNEVCHQILRLARNPLLRTALRGAQRGRLLLKPVAEVAHEHA
jgi:hypothetical protein